MARGNLKDFFSDQVDKAKDSMKDLLKSTFKFQNLVEMIVDELQNWNEEFNTLISSTGIARKALKDIRDVQFEAVKSLAYYGIGVKEVYASTTELFEKFRSIYNVNKDLIEESTNMARGWGIGAAESAEILRLQTEIFGMTKEQRIEQDKLVKRYGTLYGVGASKIAKDIADNAEGIARWSRDTGTNLIKAAAFARKLGTELADILAFSEKLLDIEASTQDMFSLQVLTGRTIDTQRMRQLAFMGKQEELTRLMVSEISKFSDKQYQNAIIQQQIADTFGISVVKVRQIQTAHEQINKELVGWNKAQKETFMLYRNMNFADPFKSEEAVSNITRMGEYIKAVILPYIQNVVKSVDHIAGILNDYVFEPLARWITQLEEREKQVVHAGMGALTPVVLLGGIKVIGLAISTLGKWIGGLFTNIFKGPKIPKGGKMLSPAHILSYSTAIIAFAGGIWILSKAVQNFASVGDMLGQSLMAILGAGTLFAGFITLLSTLAPLSPGILLTTAAIGAFAGAIWILSKASQNFVPLIEAISDSFSNMFNAVKGLSGPQLLGISAGLTSLGVSLTLLTGASLVSGLLGGGLLLTIKYLITLSKTADPLMKVANSLERIGDSLYKINSIKDTNLSKNLNALSSFSKKTSNMPTEKIISTQKEELKISPANIYLDKYKVGEVIFELSRGKL